jgi:hypothetical protein
MTLAKLDPSRLTAVNAMLFEEIPTPNIVRPNMSERTTFSAFIDKAFWALLIAVLGFGVRFIGMLSKNVMELNNKLEVVIVETRFQARELSDLDARVAAIEKGEQRRDLFDRRRGPR